MKGFELGQNLRAEQRLALEPRMLQSIEVLALPRLELEGFLQGLAEENAALVLDAPSVERIPEGRRGSWEDAEAHDAMLQAQPDRARSLPQAVQEQLAGAGLEPEIEQWVHFLAGCLDERGFLPAEDEVLLALARDAGLPDDPGRLGCAVAAMQSLEPRGMGARGPIEALLLQLDPADADYALLCRLLEDFLEELARNKLPGVARAMGLELCELERLLGVLRGLEQRPLAGLVEEPAALLRADVVVDWTGSGYEVRLASGALPAVSIDEDLRALARDPGQPSEVRGYLRGKLDQARWIVEAVEQRGRTLLRVASLLFRHQEEFLERGTNHLRPLRMGEVAQELGLHLSTVSRTVAGKVAQTPQGLFPLRHFFQGSAGDAETSRDSVRERVRAVIVGEDARRPLSDDDVVAALAAEGLELARRTVTKYRQELAIPSSYRRRRHG